MDKSKTRNSNYEILRIVSMLLIVSWHYATQFNVNGTGFLDKKISIFHVFASVIGSWGQLGVDLFIIISVYFLHKSNRFKSYKVIDISIVSIFYGFFWAIICFGFGIPITINEIIKATFATFTGENWFAFAYLLLYIFHPILNSILNMCSEKQLKKITVLLTIFVSCLKTIYHGIPICDFLFMVNIYFMVSFIEKKDFKSWFKIKPFKKAIICTLLLLGLHLFAVIIGSVLNNDLILKYSYYLNLRGSFFILVDALLLFYWVNTLNARYFRIVNAIASTCFAVFLSHQLIGYKVWYFLLYKDNIGQLYACINMIISIFIIFICCSFIDLIRQFTLGKFVSYACRTNIIKNKLDKIDYYMNFDKE